MIYKCTPFIPITSQCDDVDPQDLVLIAEQNASKDDDIIRFKLYSDNPHVDILELAKRNHVGIGLHLVESLHEEAKQLLADNKLPGDGVRCFVDVNGMVWVLDSQGNSNYPAFTNIEGDTIQILGEKDDMGPGRAVEDEYTIHSSLLSLSRAIEQELHK